MKPLFWLLLIYLWFPIELFLLLRLRIKKRKVKSSKLFSFLNSKFSKSYRDKAISKYLVSYLKENEYLDEKDY